MENQAGQVVNDKGGEEMDEDEIGTTDADTSSWESEPNTARSSRQYHPVKAEQTTLVAEDEDSQQPLINGDFIAEHPGDQELLSSQYLRKTFGLGKSESLDEALDSTEALDSNENTEDTVHVQNGRQRDGQSSSNGVEDTGGTGSDHSLKGDERGSEDVIEELDLTKQPQSKLFGRGPVGIPQAQFVFMPSLGPFGPSPFGSLITGLLSSDGDGFENDADISSQSEAEEERLPRAKSQYRPEVDERRQQERWEHLFGMLEQQHRQQVILQQEHHERQVHLLQMQLARLTEEQEDLITKQHQEPLGNGTKTMPTNKETTNVTTSKKVGDIRGPKTPPRRSPNGRERIGMQDRNVVFPGFASTESSDQDTYSASEESDATLEGSLEDASETLMTTWSDVMEQKQAEVEKGRTSHQEEEERTRLEVQDRNLQEPQTCDNREEDDRFITLQNHFAQQQQQLEQQYTLQVRGMQQQWLELQKQQLEQQEVLRHLLSHQQERFTQTHRDIQGVTQGSKLLEQVDTDLRAGEDRGSPTSDDTSTTCSDFTYWKQAEHDTYKALPDLSADDVTREQDNPQPDIAQVQSAPHQQHKRSSNITDGQLSAVASNPIGQRSPDHTGQWLANGSGQRSPHLSGQSSSPQRSADDGDIGEDTQLTSSLRLNLREKHARHIADLKAYYESELQDLQFKFTEATSLKDHSPDKVMTRTNQRLQNNCIKLESALKSANSRIEDLENTVKALEARLGEMYSTADSSVANLQQKVSDLKQMCRHKELDVQSLEKRNRELQVSLDQAYQLQDAQAMDEHREQKILKRVLVEYKALAEKHEVTKELLHDTETQLYESKAKITDLTRTLSHLEFEVKRMDLDGSIIKRQTLSKSLSGTSLRSDTKPNTNSATVITQDKNRTQDRNQTSESLKDTNNIPDSPSIGTSSVSRSVEDKKFLKPSTNYNMLTGEKLMSESGNESLSVASDADGSSLTQPEDTNRINIAAPGRHSTLDVPFDTNVDEERPLSPMMKAARQFDFWKTEESMNASNDKGLLGNSLNGMHFTGRQVNGSQQTSLHHHNHSASNSSPSHEVTSSRGRLNGGPLTPDASIHIWPGSEKATKQSAILPGTSKLGTALAHSSPKQLARQTLAKAIKPKDHDLFPVRGSKDSLLENSKRSSPNEMRQSVGKVTTAVDLRKGKESPRRQLFADEKKSGNKRRAKGGVASSPPAGDHVADSVLAKVRAGDVQTRADWEGTVSRPQHSHMHTPKSQTEAGHDIIQRINDYQMKLDQLMIEKRQLETTLSHVPITGRVSRQRRQEEERLEQRLEHVTRELGSVRMLLRRYNALKSSI